MKSLNRISITFRAIALLVCLLATHLAGADVSLPKAFDGLPSYSVSFPKGTMSQTTYGITRGSEGLMWISTASGIDRFDGLSFRHYSLSRTQMRHIRDGFMASLYQDREGKIWAFTERSIIYCYDPETDQFEQKVSLRIQSQLHCVKTMLTDGNLLHLGTSSGFRIFDMELDSVVQVIDPEDDIHQVIPFSYGNYLYGTSHNVGIYDPRQRDTRLLCNLKEDVMYMHYDAQHNIVWVGTNGNGLYVFDAFDPSRLIHVEGSENCIVTTIAPLNDKYMLVGTDGNGLKICALPQSGTFVDHPSRLYQLADDSPSAPYQFPLSVVKGLLVDNGHIWVSMDMGGIALMNPGGELMRLVNPQARNVSDNTVFGADFDQEGQLWVAFNNSIGCFDRSGLTKKIYMNHESRFLTVKHSSDGTVWGGGYNTGLWHFDPVTGQREHISSIADQPVLDCIWSVKEDVHNDLWIGGLNFPLTRLHFTEPARPGHLRRAYERTFYYGVNQVSDILEINPDTMVVCTFDGFWIVNSSTGETSYKLHNDSVWNFTNCIGAAAVRNGHELWLATTGAGLVCYDLHTDNIESYNLAHGLPSLELRGVEMLNDSLLCASTENNGLFVFDAKNRRYLYTLGQREFTGINQFIRSASAASDDGILVFGSDQGAVIFNENIMREEDSSYQILVEGEYAHHDKSVHLPASDRNLSLEFTTTDVYNQSVYRFEYRIKGLVNSWQSVDASRRIRYMAIPAGTYTLEVRAIDASNRSSVQQVKVVADRELFLRWYFILAYILIVLALCFFAAVWAVNYIMRRNDGILGEEHSRLSLASISSIRQAKVNYRLLVKQSEYDALTALHNRYSGQRIINHHLKHKASGVLLLLDCDKFKHVNDTYGHLMGDELLIRIARAMDQAFPSDTTIRMGGDEFAIFLKGTHTREEVEKKVYAFFALVKAIRLSSTPDYAPSVSIGAAFASPQADNFEALYSHADKNLYESKELTGCSLHMDEE